MPADTNPSAKFTVTSLTRTGGCLFMASWTRTQITKWGYLRDAMSDDRCTDVAISRGGKDVVSVHRSTAKHAVKDSEGTVYEWTSHGEASVAGVPRNSDVFKPTCGFADGWRWADEATSREMAARRANITAEERAVLTQSGVDVDALIARDKALGFV